MSETADRYCPRCETTMEFNRAARTVVDLGVKTKWRCQDCGFAVVNIDPDVEAELTP